jgi:hypothetical protein
MGVASRHSWPPEPQIEDSMAHLQAGEISFKFFVPLLMVKVRQAQMYFARIGFADI